MKRSISPKQQQRNPAKINWFAKYKADIEMYQTANLRKELDTEGSAFDETDEKFVAPSVLTKEGDLNLPLLFSTYDLQPADRRYLLRKMEKAREEFRDRILVETRMKQEEERKRLEEAEDEREIRLVKERFKLIQEKLNQKAAETDKFQLSGKEKEVREIRQQQETKKKLLQDEKETLEKREWERLRRLPDFPTTFTVCRRLHSPVRNNRARNEKNNLLENKTPLTKVLSQSRSILQQQDDDESSKKTKRLLFDDERLQETATELVSVSYAVSKKHDGKLELVTSPLE